MSISVCVSFLCVCIRVMLRLICVCLLYGCVRILHRYAIYIPYLSRMYVHDSVFMCVCTVLTIDYYVEITQEYLHLGVHSMTSFSTYDSIV